MNTERVKNHFDHIAPSYDHYKKRNSLYYDSLKNAIRQNISSPHSMKILDIGCGTGEILSFLKPKQALGVDLSPHMITMAKKKYRREKFLSFAVHDIEKKSVSGCFDYILFNDVIEHVTDIKSAFRYISQSMTSGTILILTMANPLWEPVLMVLEKLHLKMPEGDHQRISETALIRYLSQNCLKVEVKKTYLPEISFAPFDRLSLIFLYKIIKIP